ncbi:MAG TPA: class I SAM-dependent methyltransferase [Chitinophagaceae bacterium]|nr:class I SAM-dependent methyltransferase [Chitinophagaceae bacterium]
METARLDMFRNRLRKVYRHLRRQAAKMGVTCFRVYDHDLPEFPLRVEVYENDLYVSEYQRRHGMSEKEHHEWLESAVSVLREELGFAEGAVHLKLRHRKAGRQGQYRKTAAAGAERVVTENGLKFLVNLSDYIDTGLFLDQRLARQLIRQQSKDKSVLNLFAYTGTFSVCAARGGAAGVTTVDLSNTYLSWAQKNFELNQLPLQSHQFVQADVLQWLPAAAAASYDLVVLDPPTFSNSARMKGILDVQRDHVALINQCLSALKPGGLLYFSTNYKKFHLDHAAIAASEIRDMTRATTPFDFEGKLDRQAFLIRAK